MVHSPSHVVHVIATDNFAGVERYVTYVAPLQVAAGWSVTVVGGTPEPMRAALEPAGVRHVAYQGARALRRLLRRTSATVVHAHMTDAEFAAVLAVGRRTPVVATRHFAATRGSSAPARVVGRWIRKRLALQISISQFVADHIGEPSIVIPNGVPDSPPGAHQERVVFMAQRLESEKQTGVAIEAWALSGLADDGWQLHIAGRGAMEQDLRRLADELGVASSVHFLGFVDDAPLRMATCGLFLATAPHEPFGLSVAEAMSTGASVVVAGGGAHRELVGASTMMFPPGNSAECAAALRVWCANPPLREAVGAQLRSRQQQLFSVQRHVDLLLQAYNDTCTLPSSVTPRLDE